MGGVHIDYNEALSSLADEIATQNLSDVPQVGEGEGFSHPASVSVAGSIRGKE